MTSAPVTTEVARWVAGLTWEDVPEAVRHHVSRTILDYCAAAAAGADSDEAAAARRLATQTYRDGAASLVGSRTRLNAAGAAFVNGTSAHAVELDDGFTPGSVHPGAVVIPAALALGQEVGATAETLLPAIAAGYELVCRIAAAGHPTTVHRGFHNTGLAGPFGSAAAAAVLLGLDGTTTAEALGVAGSHAAGLFEFLHSGGAVKRAHAGKAARDGVLSARMAQEGIDGPPTVLEGPRGYFHAFVGPEADPVDVLDGLGSTWRMLGSYIKPYPCCRHLHSALDAINRLGAEAPAVLADPSQVERVEVETFEVAAGHASMDTSSILSAQLSIPFAVAARLQQGQFTLAELDERVRLDAAITGLMERVQVATAPELDAAYPRLRPARVTVHNRDGSSQTAQVDQPSGEPDAPLSDADIEAKVRTFASSVIGEAAVDELIGAVWQQASADTIARLLEADR